MMKGCVGRADFLEQMLSGKAAGTQSALSQIRAETLPSHLETWSRASNQCRRGTLGRRTQTCGERLKGLNKVFISGVSFWRWRWRWQSAQCKCDAWQMKREYETHTHIERDSVWGRTAWAASQKPRQTFAKTPNSAAGTWNVLNATLRVTFAECECHFACSSRSVSLHTALFLSLYAVAFALLARRVKNMLFHKFALLALTLLWPPRAHCTQG